MAQNDVPSWRTLPMIIGYGLTLIFLVFWVTVALVENPITNDCSTGLCRFWNSAPNEIGDTFAGLFGSLAFVWIIVTVLLQGRELAAQREELKLTRLEVQEQRKATQEVANAQDAQVDLLRAQGEVLLEEQSFRREEYWAQQEEKLSTLLRVTALKLFSEVQKIQFGDSTAIEVKLANHIRNKFPDGRSFSSADAFELVGLVDYALDSLIEHNSFRVPVASESLDKLLNVLSEHQHALGKTSRANQLAKRFDIGQSLLDNIGKKMGEKT